MGKSLLLSDTSLSDNKYGCNGARDTAEMA